MPVRGLLRSTRWFNGPRRRDNTGTQGSIVGDSTRRGARLIQTFVLVVTALGLPIVLADVSGAAPGAPTPAMAAVSEGPDYSSEAYADPIDMNNIEDFNPTPMTNDHAG